MKVKIKKKGNKSLKRTKSPQRKIIKIVKIKKKKNKEKLLKGINLKMKKYQKEKKNANY